MKWNVNFTRGEWVAALALLALILAGYLFYAFYDRPRQVSDMSQYVTVYEEFNRRQESLRDSMATVRAQRRYDSGRHYAVGDTNPKTGKSERKPMYDIVKLDLNHCDTGDIVVVPLFGSKRAARLVEYRERLGGFYSLAQVREVFVLQDMDVSHMEKYFYVNPDDVRKININKATYKEMVSHPYFDAYLTKTVLHYREQYGDIHSMEELQQVTHAYPELVEKLRHYVVF